MVEGQKKKRIEYLDRLRGLAVVAMFYVHSPYPWMNPSIRTGPYGSFISQISGFVAPVFMFLAGVSVAIVASRIRDMGRDSFQAKKKLVFRGLSIVAVGYGLQLSFWVLRGFHGDLGRLLKVEILQCIGMSLAILVLTVWPKKRVSWAALAAVFVFVLGAQITWRIPLDNWIPSGIAGYFTHLDKLSRFPLFPYGGWIALGMFVGPIWHFAIGNPRSERRFWIGLGVAALLMYVAFSLTAKVYYHYRLSDFTLLDKPPRTTVHYFFFKTSILFALFIAAKLTSLLLDRFPAKVLVLFGRTSLFGYCVHLILIYHLFSLFWRQNLSAVEHLFAVVLLGSIMYGLCFLWNRLPVARLAQVLKLKFFPKLG